MTTGEPKIHDYPVSEEEIVQNYCMHCRLLNGAEGQQQRDCIDCYTALRKGFEDTEKIIKYRMK